MTETIPAEVRTRTFAEQLAWDLYHETNVYPVKGNWWDRAAPIIQRALDERDRAMIAARPKVP